jgi:hypothetical protein
MADRSDLPGIGRPDEAPAGVVSGRLVVVDSEVQELFMDVLDEHLATTNGEWNCTCGMGGWAAESGYRRHLALELAHALAVKMAGYCKEHGCHWAGSGGCPHTHSSEFNRA